MAVDMCLYREVPRRNVNIINELFSKQYSKFFIFSNMFYPQKKIYFVGGLLQKTEKINNSAYNPALAKQPYM